MKPFTFYRIIILLFVFGANNLFAVQTTATDPTKTESVVSIATVETTKKSQKNSKRKSRLVEKFKKKFLEFFPKDSTSKNAAKNENLETRTHGLAIASLVCGILGVFTLGILSILAIIFAGVSLKKINSSGGFYTGRGLAMAGMVLGILFVTVFFLILVANIF